MTRTTLIFTAILGVVFIALVQDPIWSLVTYPYLWGPIVADAQEHTVDGIKPGYNPVNTTIYGVFLVTVLYIAYMELRDRRIRLDARFFVVLLPFITLGPSLRVLEDASFFRFPAACLFISPILYAVVALLFFVLLTLSRLIANLESFDRRLMSLFIFAGLASLQIPVYAHALWTPNPLLPVAFLTAGVILVFRTDTGSWYRLLGVFGLYLLSMPLLPLFQWFLFGSWRVGGPEVSRNLPIMLIIVAMASGLTFSVYVIWKNAYSRAIISHPPVGMPIFFGHFLDASATFIGIDFFGAWEKHPLPRILIDAFGTASIMIPLKALVIALVFYLLLGPFRDEMSRDRTMAGIIYVAIFILGFAPGLRDTLRLGMGV